MRNLIEKIVGIGALLFILSSAVTFGDEWNGTISGKLFYLDGNVGIGTDSPRRQLDVNGSASIGNTRFDGQSIELNMDGTGNRFAYIDFHGDDTYTDWGLRVIRYNAGENTNSMIRHRGLGDFIFQAVDNSNIKLSTNSATRMIVTPTGLVGIGTMTPGSLLDVNGGIRAKNFRMYGSGWKSVIVESADSGTEISFRSNGTVGHDGSIVYNANKDMTFHTDRGTVNNSDMILTHDGKLGVGTATPRWPLDVVQKEDNHMFAYFETLTNKHAGIVLKNSVSQWNISTNMGAGDLRFWNAGLNNYAMTVGVNGNVAIGSVNPLTKLHVDGTIMSTGASNIIKIGPLVDQTFLRYDSNAYYIAPFGANTGDPASSNFVSVGGGPDLGRTVQFRTVSDTYLAAFNGAVGIGTSNTAGYKLAVNGKIRATEIKVDTGWADFVFEDDYELRPLSEVESFIEENGHLPEIPSAAEVEAEGVSLGEMDSKLLQKIEELTLYMIELEKEVKALKAERE